MPTAVIAAALALAACSSFGSGSREDDAEVNVYPVNYKADLLAFMRTYLNDPTNVHDAQITEPALRPIARSTRYIACVRYNPRNNDGRYLGSKESAAIYQEGRFTQLLDRAGELCKDAAYQPFPELQTLKR